MLVMANIRKREDGGMTREYVSWWSMRGRCQNQNNPNYPNYGARGISVCDKWNYSFEAILDAPCKWCGYDGPDYWQENTHGHDCVWRSVGGLWDRERALETFRFQPPMPAVESEPRAEGLTPERETHTPERPTAWAYEQACKALAKHRKRADKAEVELSALRAEVAALRKERDEYRTLAKVGQWHDDCRPNRQQAAREIKKQQAVINKMADAVAEANQRAEQAEAKLAPPAPEETKA
jgi:hypothetical protein